MLSGADRTGSIWGLRSFEVASFHGGLAVPVTEFDPRRLKGIALVTPGNGEHAW